MRDRNGTTKDPGRGVTEADVAQTLAGLRSQLEHYRQLVEEVNDVAFILDRSGTIQYISPAMEPLSGYRPDEIVGRNFAEFIDPADLPALAASFARTLAGQTEPSEFRVRTRDGGTRWVRSHSRPFKDGAEVVGVRGSVSDITDRKQAEEELRRARDELERRVEERTAELSRINAGLEAEIARRKQIERELTAAREFAETANRARSEFLATVSHEIRTPLNGVLGMTELLLDSGVSGEQEEFVRIAHRSARKLLEIINDILDMAQLEAGRLALNAVAFELAPCVEEALQTFRDQARSKGLRMTVDVAPPPGLLVGDAERLKQILGNLVSNAVKFTDHGEIRIRVSHRVWFPGEILLRIEVADTGVGIPPEARSRLFQPFSLVDASLTRSFGGAGLGLAISRQLVQLMGGEIDFTSQFRRGSTFWVEVPMEVRPGAEATRGAAAVSPQPAAAGRCRVLVVDDNALNREIATHLLARLGLAADHAASGLEAIQAVSRGSYDAILMDCQMPQLDGYEATRQIRRREAGGPTRVPIVALTANVLPGDRQLCLDAGMDDYLTKPVRLERLAAVLRRWIPLEAPPPATAAAAPGAAPPAAPQRVVDRERALAAVGGDMELLRELAGMFQRDAEQMLARVRAEAARGDAEAMWKAAHSLKGALASFGAQSVFETAQRAESIGRSGDLSSAPEVLQALARGMAQLQQELAEICAE